MSLTTLNDVLVKARQENYAVPNFDVYNLELLEGVMRACKETRSPVILAYGGGFLDFSPIKHFAKMMVSMAEESNLPVVIHWDHGANLEEIQLALDCGFTSVMMDASALPYKENVALTRKVVDMCHGLGISVESELGHVGDEGQNIVENYSHTDPAQAIEFVNETQIDTFALALGNAHGVYTSAPQLRFDILDECRKNISIPLVLHGASGIGTDDVKKAIAHGIAKVNIHTELCQAAEMGIRTKLGGHFWDVTRAQIEAVKQRAIEKIILCGSNGKA